MDRQIVYPGAIPLDTDILNIQRNAMISDGFLAAAILGNGPIVNGLACAPTSPASMSIIVGPGMIAAQETVDPNAYGSLGTDSDTLVKVGINTENTISLAALTAPGTVGQSIIYVIEAAFSETDTTAIVLPYYNAANPSVGYSGPNNTGAAQNTQRIQRVALTLKTGVGSATPTAPAVDAGAVGLWQITVPYGATTVTSGMIAQIPTAPFIAFNLSNLRPGFASGIWSSFAHGTPNFTVPAGVTQIEVELWGAGSGSWASVSGCTGGGGSGGGYAKKRITDLTPGTVIPITIGQGGAAGVSNTSAPGSGGNSQFGSGGTIYCSATGGTLNPIGTVGAPYLGNQGGFGSGGDINLYGGDGGNGQVNQGGLTFNNGGMGGTGPLSGGMEGSGTTGVAGRSPGGGASGAGSGATGTTAYAAAAGADGGCIVRW